MAKMLVDKFGKNKSISFSVCALQFLVFCISTNSESLLLAVMAYDCYKTISSPLLFGRKVMTNLDSIFKTRDITLPAKVHLVKAMVFPVVMYGCESWTVKKAEY